MNTVLAPTRQIQASSLRSVAALAMCRVGVLASMPALEATLLTSFERALPKSSSNYRSTFIASGLHLKSQDQNCDQRNWGQANRDRDLCGSVMLN